MKKILILGAPLFQIPVVKKAKEMGLEVGIVDINPQAPALKFADTVFVASIRDKNGILEIAKNYKPNGIVIGACDTSVTTAAYVCNKLGLPCYSEETALKSTNKLEMLYAFEKYAVDHPKFQLVRKNDLRNFKMQIPYPAISKPINSSGGRGIFFIKDEKQLQEAVAYSSDGYAGDILVEEYMEGNEVSVEVIVLESIPYVLQITDKITSGKPNFYEIGHSQPSRLPDEIKIRVSNLAKRAVTACGINNSPAHVEIKITEDGPKMVELGARLGGDWITSFLINTSVSGINMTETAIRLALGEKIEKPQFHNSGKSVAVRFLCGKSGKVKEIIGFDYIKVIPGIITADILIHPGDKIAKSENNATRYGYIVAEGESTEQALSICEQALNQIKIIYE